MNRFEGSSRRKPWSTILFFCFQAEDGIRDLTVTGVQTCALPISNIRRVLEVIEQPPGVPEMPNAIHFPSPVRGYVELDDVCFSYRDHTRVLEGIRLKLEPGEKVALVGMSGSGKSTIAKLIARLYDADRGAVYVDGLDVRNVRLESLRKKVFNLLQDAESKEHTSKLQSQS